MIKKRPKVCVLLAAFNGAEYIEAQIESILLQQDVDVRIYVRDDCSSDATVRKVESFAERDPRVSLLRSRQNTGKAGFNFYKIIQEVPDNFDYYAFSDQDDIWLPNKLISAVNSLRKSESACYSCAVEAFWIDGRKNILGQNAKQLPCDAFFEAAGQGCTYVFTQEFFLKIQNFLRTHGDKVKNFEFHDWLTYVLARAWGDRWYFDPVAHIQYRQHNNNEIGARGGVKAALRRLQKIRNGWYKKQVEIAADIYFFAAGSNHIALSVRKELANEQRSMNVLKNILFYSRRRLSDRVVLAFSYIMKWI